jgi:hypothetical protein
LVHVRTETMKIYFPVAFTTDANLQQYARLVFSQIYYELFGEQAPVNYYQCWVALFSGSDVAL